MKHTWENTASNINLSFMNSSSFDWVPDSPKYIIQSMISQRCILNNILVQEIK